MNNKLHNSLIVLALLALSTLNTELSTARAQGTAFTYTGQLQFGGSPASGSYSLTFTLFTSTNAAAVAVAGPVTNNAVGVTNGLFTALIDFGSEVFTGETNWLQIGVTTNGATNFMTLTPRQQLTPVPYAIYAENAGELSIPLSASQLTSIGNTNIGAYGNFFIGGSGNPTTSGYYNTGDGQYALQYNTIGTENTAVGASALQSNTNGIDNTAIGFAALQRNTIGAENTAAGAWALQYNTNGNDNAAIGFAALELNTSGGANTASGFYALMDNTTGSGNTADGDDALNFNTTGTFNTATGQFALHSNTIASYNTADGASALVHNTNGAMNTATGFGALYNSTSGLNNIALGFEAGFAITTGSDNIDIGNGGQAGDTGIIRIGSGQSQTFIAGVINGNGGGLTNLSVSAAQLTAGTDNNVFVGPSGNSTTSGSGNTATGYAALQDDTSGSANTAVGFAALLYNTNGIDNTAIGESALIDNTSGSNNIALGYNAGENIITGSSNIDIGNGGLATDTGIIRIGASQTACYLAGTVYANGVALTSDRNAKENFIAINARDLLDKVASLPVSEWNYKADDQEVHHIGPMAQDFQAAFKLSADDKHISVVDENGVALAAIQGLNQKLEQAVKAKDGEIQTLKERNDSLAQRLSQLEETVKQLAARK